MKIKTKKYTNLNTNLKYRLNDKKINLEINSFDLYNNINLGVNLSNDGILNCNYNIKIFKLDSENYKIIKADGEIIYLESKYYYRNDNNERIYVSKEDVQIKPDGSLWYLDYPVKVYYKNDNGLILSGDYSDFIDSEKTTIFKLTDDGYTKVYWVVSSSEVFTSECVNLARETNIQLIDGKNFASMLLDAGFFGVRDVL